MPPFFTSRSLLPTAGVAVAVLALSVAMSGTAVATQPARHGTINTRQAWDRSTYIAPFGCPNTTTYGQVVMIPAGKTSLDRFVFWMNDFGGTGSMVARGELYAWDGVKATGSALFESAPRTLSFGDSHAHREGFLTGGAAVTAGSQYVMFVSIDKDFESCTDYTNEWGGVDDSTYPDGTFVYQNNSGDESQWTTSSWNQYGFDLVFKVFMS